MIPNFLKEKEKRENFSNTNQHSIEFEIKNFAIENVCDIVKVIKSVYSPTFTYGEYDWFIHGFVFKNDKQNGELYYVCTLKCESDDETNFPLFANIKYSILNKDKDSRKDLSKCNLY